MVLLYAVLALFLSSSVHAATLSVPSQHATIQAAHNAAGAGDIINVAPGTYNETVTVTKNSLTFLSTTKHGAIVRGGGTRQYGFFISGSSSDGVIDGFEITGQAQTGIQFDPASSAARRWKIRNNKINRIWENGIVIRGSNAQHEVHHNEIFLMGRAQEAMGIEIQAWNSHIHHNQIYLIAKDGIRVGRADNLVENNIVYQAAVCIASNQSNGGNEIFNNYLYDCENPYQPKHNKCTEGKNNMYEWFMHNTTAYGAHTSFEIGTNLPLTSCIQIKNNAFLTTSNRLVGDVPEASMQVREDRTSNLIIDGNIYELGAAPMYTQPNVGGAPIYTTIAEVRANTPYEDNGQTATIGLQNYRTGVHYAENSPVFQDGLAVATPYNRQIGARGLVQTTPQVIRLFGTVAHSVSAGNGALLVDGSDGKNWNGGATSGWVIINLNGGADAIFEIFSYWSDVNSNGPMKTGRVQTAEAPGGPWTTVLTITQSMTDTLGGRAFFEMPSPVTTKYVRFFMDSTWLNDNIVLTEVAFLNMEEQGGDPDPPPPPPPPPPGPYGVANESCVTTQQGGTGGLIIHNNTGTLQAVVEGNANRTILVRAGTYNVNGFNVANNTIVKPYDCEAVRVNIGALTDMTQQNFTVAGLTFHCATTNICLRMSGADNAVFRNNRVQNAADAAFIVRSTSTGNTIEGNDFLGACGNVRYGDWLKFTEGISGIIFRRNRAQLCSTNTNNNGNDMISVRALTQPSASGPAVLITNNLFGTFYSVEQAMDIKRNVTANAYVEFSYNTMIGPHYGRGSGDFESMFAVNASDMNLAQGDRNCQAAADCPRHKIHHNYLQDSWSFNPPQEGNAFSAIGIKPGGAVRPVTMDVEFNVDFNAQNTEKYMTVSKGIAGIRYRHNSLYRGVMSFSGDACDQAYAGGGPNLEFSSNVLEETRILDTCNATPPGARWLIEDNVFDNMPITFLAGNQDTGNVVTNITYANRNKTTPDFTVLEAAHSQKGALPVPVLGSAVINNDCRLRITMVPYNDLYDHGPISKADAAKLTVKYDTAVEAITSASIEGSVITLDMASCPVSTETVTFSGTHGWCEDSANIGGSATMMNARCLAVTDQAVTNNSDEDPEPTGEATFYVDGSCGTNGNGTTETCGASGPWNSLEAAIVPGCVGMVPGDILEIKGGTYYENENLVPGVGCTGMVFKSADDEAVVFDGSVDIAGQGWLNIGFGVYESQYDFGDDEFPFTAWYDQGAGELRLNLVQSVQTCTQTLAAGMMRFNPVTNRVCVHLHDSSSPVTANYIRIPQQEAWIRLQGSGVDSIKFLTGTNSSFHITRYVERGLTGHHVINNNIVVDGLEFSWMHEAAIIFTSGPGQNGLTVRNANIHHIGNYGIQSTGDTGTGRLQNNTITDIQTTEFVEQCLGVGAGCLGTRSGDGAAIRVLNRDGLGYDISDNTILRFGGGYSGRAYGVWLQKWASNNRVERNYIAHSADLADRGYGIYSNLDATGEFIQNNRYFNNRMYNLDVCFAQNYAANISDQAAGLPDRFAHNTCVDPHDYGMLAEGAGAQTRTVNIQNNVFAAYTTSPTFLLARVNDTGWNDFAYNAVECDSCVTDQVIIDHRGVTVRQAGDCTEGIDCLAEFNASSVNREGNVEGNTVVDVTGENPTLHIDGTSVAFDVADTLSADAEFNNDDCCGNDRPQFAGNDMGAHETDNPGDPMPPSQLVQSAYQFYSQFLKERIGGLGINTPARAYENGALTLRIELAASAGASTGLGIRLQSRLCNPACGAWAFTTQESDDATGVYLVDHPFREDNSQTTRDIGVPPATYRPGTFKETASPVALGLNENESTELEYSLRISSVPIAGSIVEFRLLDNSKSITYDETPMIFIVHGRLDSSGGDLR